LEGVSRDLAPGTKVIVHSDNPVLCGQTATVVKYAGGRRGYELKLDSGKMIHKLPAMIDLVTSASIAWGSRQQEESQEEKASFFDLENNRMVKEIGEISAKAKKAREKVHSFFSNKAAHATGVVGKTTSHVNGVVELVRTGTSDFFSPAMNAANSMFYGGSSDGTGGAEPTPNQQQIAQHHQRTQVLEKSLEEDLQRVSGTCKPGAYRRSTRESAPKPVSNPPTAGSSVAARAARFEKAAVQDDKPTWMSRKPSDIKKKEKASKFTAAPTWEKDDEAKACHECKTEFGFFTRKHHCRRCGQIYCEQCTSHTIKLEIIHPEGGKYRVCNSCYAAKGSPTGGDWASWF